MIQILKARRPVLALALVLLVFAACAQTQLRIMASNLTSGNYQSYQSPGIDILKALKADVILMQEFNVNTVSGGANDATAVQSWVTTNFGAGYYWFRETTGAQLPNGVISKYPITASGQWTDPATASRDFAWAKIDIPGSNDLYVISVHLLTSNSTDRNTEAQAIVNTYIPSLNIPAGSYLVMGGDFNTQSRTESCITTLSADFVTASPYPVGQDGDGDTNSTRAHPEDWVLVNSDLNALKTTTTYGSYSYANGLVFDTRNFTQPQLDANFSPALTTDSGASQMQHMGVVKTFIIPSGASTSNGDTPTLSVTDRAPTTCSVNVTIPMQSIDISVSANEWDAASVTITKSGTLGDSYVTANVYSDTNNNGAIDSGESVLGSAVFSSGVATVSLSPTPRAQSGSPIHLLAAATIGSSATDAGTFRYTLTSVTHNSSGGSDNDPSTGSPQSGLVTVSNPSATSVGTGVVINKYFNSGTTNDVVELLVVQDGLDLRGMILKDFSSNMANDGGGKFTISNDSLWQSVRAGTLIVLRNDTSAADTTVGPTDFNLDIGLQNTTYFTNSGGTFDISTTEMVMVKAATSGASGVTSSIHCLAGGTAGTQYTSTATPKLRASGTSGSNQYVYADNSDSLLTDFTDATGTATGAATGLTFGSGNNTANTNFITFLRGPNSTGATLVTANSFQANWDALTGATSYRLDVATDSGFSSMVSGYANLNVGNVTSYNVVGLTYGQTYYYRVRGVNSEATPSGNSTSANVLVPVVLSMMLVE